MSKVDIKASYTDVADKNMQEVLTYVGQISTTQQVDIAIEMMVGVLKDASKVIPTSTYRPNIKPYW